jgi:PKHD-type hydroxylase
MLLQIENVLSQAEAAAMRDALAPADLWADGGETAAGAARAVKRNLQARPDQPAVAGVLAKARAAILANELSAAAALPDRFARVMANRYGEGMEYGAHVDAPYIDGVRTDLSFTLFLSAPDDYDGGALVIDGAGSEDSVKLAAGALVLYPATAIHRVETVTRGERLAIVGWIRSRVRSGEARAILFELAGAIAGLEAAGGAAEIRSRLANVRNNLLRLVGE